MDIPTKELVRLIYDRRIRYVMVDGIAHVPADAVDEYRAGLLNPASWRTFDKPRRLTVTAAHSSAPASEQALQRSERAGFTVDVLHSGHW